MGEKGNAVMEGHEDSFCMWTLIDQDMFLKKCLEK